VPLGRASNNNNKKQHHPTFQVVKREFYGVHRYVSTWVHTLCLPYVTKEKVRKRCLSVIGPHYVPRPCYSRHQMLLEISWQFNLEEAWRSSSLRSVWQIET
jgi:hypothetical protein